MELRPPCRIHRPEQPSSPPARAGADPRPLPAWASPPAGSAWPCPPPRARAATRVPPPRPWPCSAPRPACHCAGRREGVHVVCVLQATLLGPYGPQGSRSAPRPACHSAQRRTRARRRGSCVTWCAAAAMSRARQCRAVESAHCLSCIEGSCRQPRPAAAPAAPRQPPRAPLILHLALVAPLA